MAYRNRPRAQSRSPSPIDKKKRREGHRGDEFSNNLVDFDKNSYKSQVPCSIIILRGLAQHLTEQDIKTATLAAGVASKDVKIMKKKDKGSSKGVGFVEFYSVEDAQRLLITQKGELMIRGQYRAIMQYFETADWYCHCGVRNYKKRDSCLKCGNTEICPYPTNIVIITHLPHEVTEAHLLEIVNKKCDLAIKCVRKTKDGNCYIEMNNITDTIQLYNTLGSVNLKVGFYRHKTIPNNVSVTRTTAVSAASAVAAAQCTNTLADVPKLAEYSANLYAKTPEEKKKYLEYYTQYYVKQITEGKSVSQDSGNIIEDSPDGLGSRTYPAPNVNSFQYDQTSGYYYDASTKLYYDANTQYFFNSKTNKYLYWDSTYNTYYDVPNDSSRKTNPNQSNPNAGKSEEINDSEKKVEDKDKVKVAKRVAKDMEKWAKTLNHRKEISKVAVNVEQASNSDSSTQNKQNSGSADVCFSVVGNREEHKSKKSLVAAYESDAEEEQDQEETVSGEEKLQIDWDKLACLICKRQFNSKDILMKHAQLSELHKNNLRMWYTSRNLDPNDEVLRAGQYRDRAKERRLKYGEPEKPPESKLKAKYSKVKEASITYEEPTKKGIGADNLGNKLLQKMGWSQGQGLGKANQGRTSIIEAEGRVKCAGLGTNAIGMQPGPGETYKDCVKKMMRARFEQMD